MLLKTGIPWWSSQVWRCFDIAVLAETNAHEHHKGSDKSCRSKTCLTWLNTEFCKLIHHKEPFFHLTALPASHTLGEILQDTGELSKGLKHGSEGTVVWFPEIPSNYLNNKDKLSCK